MDRIKELTAAMEAELVEIRRDLHRHPELSNEERRTSDLICACLESWGIPYERGLAGTGVMAVIQGAKPGKTVGIRADMDALPVEEAGNPPYRSECPGVMHACGHDAHTAILLGAAKLFKEMQGGAFRDGEMLFPAGGGDHRRGAADDRGRLSGKPSRGLCAGPAREQRL